MTAALLHTDGGSRGNPGPAGCGFSLTDAAGETLAAGGWFLGTTTNNVAEYSALLWGMRNALACGVKDLRVQADSELMVKQMLGAYKVKSPDLKPLFEQARVLQSRFDKFSIKHVYRSENKEADELANKAMDAHGPVGDFRVEMDGSQPTLFDASGDTAASTAAPLQDATPAQAVSPKSAPVAASAVAPQSATAPSSAPVGAALPPQCAAAPSSAPVGAALPPTCPRNAPIEGLLDGLDHLDEPGIYELTVKDHFDAAHALPGYPGQCRYLHGHTWDVEATISGMKLDEVGMLYDFKAIKDDLHAMLDAFDHHLINDVAPFDRIAPTAEHLARVLYWNLAAKLPDGIDLTEIAVWESPIAKVTYRPR